MKAILVVDMPNECVECSQYESYDCRILQQNVCLCITQCRRHENCPLKPLPPHEKALMFGSEFEMFSEKVGEIVLDAIEETDETDNTKVKAD